MAVAVPHNDNPEYKIATITFSHGRPAGDKNVLLWLGDCQLWKAELSR